MARKRFRRGRTGRRRSFWELLTRNTSGVNVNANVANNVTLFSVTEDASGQDPVTLVRIVGSVYLGIQTTPSFVAPVFYGIYWRPTSSSNSLVLSAISTADRGSEHWMFTKVVNEFQADLVHHWVDDHIDIKVMRKVGQGEEIASAADCTVNYHICENLRGLFLAS